MVRVQDSAETQQEVIGSMSDQSELLVRAENRLQRAKESVLSASDKLRNAEVVLAAAREYFHGIKDTIALSNNETSKENETLDKIRKDKIGNLADVMKFGPLIGHRWHLHDALYMMAEEEKENVVNAYAEFCKNVSNGKYPHLELIDENGEHMVYRPMPNVLKKRRYERRMKDIRNIVRGMVTLGASSETSKVTLRDACKEEMYDIGASNETVKEALARVSTLSLSLTDGKTPIEGIHVIKHKNRYQGWIDPEKFDIATFNQIAAEDPETIN